MSDTAESLVLVVFVVATSAWVGGYISLALMTRTAAAALDPAARVAFFRTLGRASLWVNVPSLLIALGTGAVLARDRAGDGLYIAAVIVAAVLLIVFAVAVFQAKRMTKLRRAAHQEPADPAKQAIVAAAAKRALVLRTGLGVLTVALVVIGSFMAV